MYEPREGTGWEEGESVFPDEFRRFRLWVDGVYLAVTVSKVSGLFVISRVAPDESHAVPTAEDVGRIQKDFGVEGWSFSSGAPAFGEPGGTCLMARAVKG